METFAAVFLTLLALPRSEAFHTLSPSLGRRTVSTSVQSNRIRLMMAGKDEELGAGAGMEEAFKELEALQSLGDAPEVPAAGKPKDEAFAQAMEGLDLQDILSQAEDAKAASPESEVELYKDMASELDVAESKDDLIAADFKEDLESEGSDGKLPSIDTQQFMDKAISEALTEAKEQDSSVDLKLEEAKEAFLDNEEIMSEVRKIFDKANDDLLEELEEIRSEQAALAKEQAERNSKASLEKIEENEKRMEIAQGNMQKMLDRVNAETKNVEDAIEDLKRAQEEADGGIDGQLSSLKSGGLVKQAALAGALLFTFRGGAETVLLLSGDPSHLLPALLQGAIALACIAGFIFL